MAALPFQGGWRSQRRRLAGALAPLLLVCLAGAALTACAGSVVDLATTVAAKDQGPIKPGEERSYVVTVVNKGPGQASRVNIHVDLPADLRYKRTVSIDGDGARTQPVDASVNSPSPEWGSWSLAAPGVAPDGTPHEASVILTFAVAVDGKPGTYQMQAKASGENTEGDAPAPPLTIELASAPKLDITVSSAPQQVRINDQVSYRVTVTNSGSGPATGVAVLVTMPAPFAFSSLDSTEGNSSRDGIIDPIKNTSEPFFASYTLPARSDSGPGILTLVFRAKVLPSAVIGSFSVSAQVTDGATGAVVTVRDTSPVTVTP